MLLWASQLGHSLEIFMKKLLLIAASAAIAGLASAQDFLVVPNANGATAATSSFLGPLSNSQRTYQLLIDESQLVTFVGKNLNGFTFRSLASATTAWPPSDVTYSNYDVYLSPGVDPSARSLTFALNIAGPQVQVRSGALTFGMETFPIAGPNLDFGPVIEFSDYPYSGGDLLVEIRHLGFTGTSKSVEAVPAMGGAAQGYGTLVSACWTGNYNGVTGSQGNAAVIQFRASASGLPLSGVIGFNDFVGSQVGRQVTVEITEVGSATAVFNGTATLGAGGTYSINVPSLAAGSYDVYFDGTPFLRKKQSLTWTAGGGTANASLVNGDVDDSGEVDAADIDAVIAAFGASVGDPNYSISVDVDGSDEVDAADIDVVIANFGAADE